VGRKAVRKEKAEKIWQAEGRIPWRSETSTAVPEFSSDPSDYLQRSTRARGMSMLVLHEEGIATFLRNSGNHNLRNIWSHPTSETRSHIPGDLNSYETSSGIKIVLILLSAFYHKAGVKTVTTLHFPSDFNLFIYQYIMSHPLLSNSV
jgi:hypothetical protein